MERSVGGEDKFSLCGSEVVLMLCSQVTIAMALLQVISGYTHRRRQDGGLPLNFGSLNTVITEVRHWYEGMRVALVRRGTGKSKERKYWVVGVHRARRCWPGREASI